MIDPALLDRLQKADPATYNKYIGTEINFHAEIYTFELAPELQDAWLQHILQDAIRARKWPHTIEYDPNTQKYDVSIMAGDRVYSGYAKESSSAILHAYLAAIEAKE